MTAAEDDEVIGIRDDLRPERFTASAEPPMLQEPVHVQVGQQRTNHSTYAKGNLQFERVVTGWRQSSAVLDLRLKR